MNKIKEFFTDWSWKEKAWLAFVLIIQTVAWAIQKESLFMLVMTLTSSLNLVLGAKGKVAGLYFAIINRSIKCFLCYINNSYDCHNSFRLHCGFYSAWFTWCC